MNSKPAIWVLQPKPKPACGVTDHSDRLIAELKLLGFKAWRITLSELSSLSATELARARLLVQISIYGYQSRGVPFKLLAELCRAKAAGSRIVGYFHELWVPDAPLASSAFLLSPIQRLLCGQLVRVCDEAHFNTAWAASWGERAVGPHAHYSPTFSNVGELEAVLPIQERPARLVCFGAPAVRRKGYAALLPQIRPLVERGLLSEVIDIGADPSAVEELKKYQTSVRVTSLGLAPPEAISEAMALAQYSLHFTPWSLATKSGIYAAAIAHGVLPLSIHEADILALSDEEKLDKYGVIRLGIKAWAHELTKDPEKLKRGASAMIAQARSHYRSANVLASHLAQALE